MVNAGTYPALCVNSYPVLPLSGTPMGGTFSGLGVSGNNFNPFIAWTSVHSIIYSYTNANGCTNTATTNITVNALPVVNAGMYPAQCVSHNIGFIRHSFRWYFHRSWCSGNNFNASVAGTGTKTIISIHRWQWLHQQCYYRHYC